MLIFRHLFSSNSNIQKIQNNLEIKDNPKIVWDGKNNAILPNSFANGLSGSQKHVNANFRFIPNLSEDVDSPG